MIRVIQRSTSEREAEIKELFNKCVPYLNEGVSLRQAVIRVTNIEVSNHRNGWFKALIDYAESQGYDYHKCRWRKDEDA